MNRLRHHNDKPLDFLIRHAMGYAEFSMKNVGRVAPTFLVQTPDGILAYFQTKWGGGEPLAEMTFGAYGALRQWNPEQTRLNGRHDG